MRALSNTPKQEIPIAAQRKAAVPLLQPPAMMVRLFYFGAVWDGFGERRERLRVLVPAGVEREDVLLEHALKEPDHVIAVLQNQPVLRGIPGEGLESELLVEAPRSLNVLDRQADRKRAEIHAFLLSTPRRLPAIGRS